MLLNGGVSQGRRYLSESAIKQMTTEQNGGHGSTSYGLGLSLDKGTFGHGGAFKNAMDIDPAAGRILVFMVQQDGPWGTPAGDAIVSTLQKLANQVVAKASSSRARILQPVPLPIALRAPQSAPQSLPAFCSSSPATKTRPPESRSP